MTIRGIQGIQAIGPSGMGATQTQTKRVATDSVCFGIPPWLAAYIPMCQDAYGTAAADIYESVQYGRSAPGVVKPSATQTPEQIAERQRQIIAQAEAEGYHPSDPTLGLTVNDLVDQYNQTVDNVKTTAKYGTYAVIAVAALAVVVALRR